MGALPGIGTEPGTAARPDAPVPDRMFPDPTVPDRTVLDPAVPDAAGAVRCPAALGETDSVGDADALGDAEAEGAARPAGCAAGAGDIAGTRPGMTGSSAALWAAVGSWLAGCACDALDGASNRYRLYSRIRAIRFAPYSGSVA